MTITKTFNTLAGIVFVYDNNKSTDYDGRNLSTLNITQEQLIYVTDVKTKNYL